MKKLFFLVLLSLLLIGILQGQPWSYNFGTGTGPFSSGSSTTFLPTPSSGTAYVRVGSGGGSLNMDNPGISGLGSDTELRMVAPTGTSATKFSLYNYTPGKTFFTKFDVLLGSSTGETATSGTIIFLQGDGTTYADGNTLSGTQVFTGLQWVFGASGAITTTYRSGSSWSSLGSTPFSQGNVYTVEIYGNNTTSSTTYSRSGSDYTIASNTLDIWINGTIIGDDLAKAQLANDANIDSFMYYGVSSTGNVANCFLDNFTYSNTLPAPSGLTPPTLSADASNNTVDNNIDITFTDNATWRAAVTAVKIGGTALTATTDYVLTSGNLQLKPSGSNPLLTSSGTKAVTVFATGYNTASVSQEINPGAPTSNSTASINPALSINTSSTVTCTAKDQYNNPVPSYVFKYDATITDASATTNESYTINGTGFTSSSTDQSISATNASGVATFIITIPAVVDGGDGLNVQVQLNDGNTNIGTAFAYTKVITAPVISNPTATSITGTTAVLGGTITSDGESPILERGTVWSTSSPVTIDDNKLAEGNTITGPFTHSRTGLPSVSTIYYCAYATNAIGTTLTTESSFTTLKAEPTDHVSSFAAGTATASTIPLTWTDAAKVTPDGYLIKGSNVSFDDIIAPVDGVVETNGALIRNVTQGSQSYTFSNLISSTTYYFKIYPYTNSGTGIDYKVDGVVPSANQSTLVGPMITDVIVPQFIQGYSGTNNNRLTTAFRFKLDNLNPNATYRYYGLFVISTDAATTSGAGIPIFISSTGTFTSNTSGNLSNALNYGEFTTDVNGSYEGWFMCGPSGNSRFAPGNSIYFRINLNDGNGGTTEELRLTSASPIKVVNFGTSEDVTQGTFLYGVSESPAKNFVFVYDNEAGTGRPIAGNVIESDGLVLSTTNIVVAYRNNVEGIEGAWGVIIPNSIGAKGFSGIKRVESRVFSTGLIYAANTDADGIWGSVDTTDPTGGTATPLNLTGEATLPVELSSFTATISAQNFVNLMWTTQSETGVSGFYIYRGTLEDASQATLISPLIAATNTSVTHTYLFTDNQIYSDGVYYYWLQNVDFDGTNSFHGPVMVNYSTGTGGPGTPVIPELTELKGIFPNPFNPTAQISYSLKDAVSVSIKVYNSRGQIVRSFDNVPGSVGNHRIVWDGRDNNGSNCSTGVYFVRMFAGKEVFTQKAVLVK